MATLGASGVVGNISTVAGISSNVTAVAGDATDIGTVADNPRFLDSKYCPDDAPEVISSADPKDLENILEIFFSTHDPTTINRQGNDIGTQYRSSIFTNDKKEIELITKHIQHLDSSKNIFVFRPTFDF